MSDNIISRIHRTTGSSVQRGVAATRLARLVSTTTVCMMLLTASKSVQAQLPATQQRSVLDQRAYPGQIAAWQTAIYGPARHSPQVLRIELPGGGMVQVFGDVSGSTRIGAVAPVQFAVTPRHLYRLELSEMPEFPGVSIYPTIELIDEIHPPANREQDFPIPVIFTEDELRLALDGQLVTRIIYVEPPQAASAEDPMRRIIPRQVRTGENVIERADELGRPIAIVRIGGRQPSMLGVTRGDYYGNGGQVAGPFAAPEPLNPAAARPESPPPSAIE